MDDNSKVLKIIHNAGFFSNASIGLMDIMIYFNRNKGLPDIVDRSLQWGHFKTTQMDNLIGFYFREVHTKIHWGNEVRITKHSEDFQFTPYRDICFEDIAPFIYKFFTPSEHVRSIVSHYEWKYQLDYENTCAIFYRGNDKIRETTIAGYDEFINQALAIRNEQPNIKFLIQPDETEFLQYCIDNLGKDKVISFEETPHMLKRDDCIFYKLPQGERAEYGAKYFAAVLCLSRCKHLITHSGNGGFWSAAYRGHANNVHQFLNDKWV